MANKNTNEADKTVMINAESQPSFSEKMGKHKNVILGIGIGVVVVILGGLGWWMWNKHANKQSSEVYASTLAKGMKSAATDSVMIKDLEKVAQSESGKTGGTLANIQLAGMYMLDNQYQKALDAINNTDIDEPVMEMNANLLKGDALVGLKKYSEAISAYEEVFNKAEKKNPEVAVRALMKKASVLDAQKKNAEALAVYEQIQKDYPDVLESYEELTIQNPGRPSDYFPLNDADIEAKAENERARTGK